MFHHCSPKRRTSCFGFGERLREFRQYFTPKGSHLKNDLSPKYCRFTCIYLASEPRISVVSAHSFADYADKDSKSCTSLHALPVVTLPVSLRGFPQRTT